jgi:hypothetical protein
LYTVSILSKAGTYVTHGTTYNSTAADHTQVLTMAELKTTAGYTDDENGADITLKYTVKNDYTAYTSDSSEVNLPEAVYQSRPAAYAGTITHTLLQKNSITLSWTALSTNA